ncbi:hypothetical protein niasHT_007334 [Heterodera trifolii]|uniref:DOMON domain-containing protein n=1 Tax=Heterodera trifolii TaxID=157864 RepID=A0ABD2LNY7_9BILA
MPPRNLSSEGILTTGIAFETEEHIEFIGVAISKQKDGEMKVIGAKAKGTEGLFELNSDNTANRVREITLKKRQNGEIIVEFARQLKGENERRLLSGCRTFHFPIKWAWIPSGSSSFSLSAKPREICELAENCFFDVQELKKKIKHREAFPPVDIAHSVDVSGKGDPCSFKNENYEVRWAYDSNTANVNFVMKQKAKSGKWWSAVGIGDNMSDMDIGVVFLDGGEPNEMGDYYSNSYGMPEKDAIQDWELNKSESEWDEQSVELHFSRQLITKDTEKDHSLDGCVLFQFAANGGTYGDGYQIHKHENWPDLYKACDLKKHCIKPNDIVDKPEISHSDDGTNERRFNNASEEQQQLLANAAKPNSLLTKNLTISQKIVENEHSKMNETKSAHEKEQKETTQKTQTEAELKPMKKREEFGTANANAETNNAFGGNITLVGEVYTAIESGKNDSINQRSVGPSGGGSGGESPFSLNAFLGNQTDGSNIAPVGVALTESGQNDTKVKETQFGIDQLIDDGKESGNGTLAANGTTTANSTLTKETITAANQIPLNGIVNAMSDNSISADNNSTTNPPTSIPPSDGQSETEEQKPFSPTKSADLQNNSTTHAFESISNEMNSTDFTIKNEAEKNRTTQIEEIASGNTTQNSTETTIEVEEGIPTAPTVTEANTTATTKTTEQSLDDQTSNGTSSPSTVTGATSSSTVTERQQTTNGNDTTTAEKANTERTAETTETETTPIHNSSLNVPIDEQQKNFTTIANKHGPLNVAEETTETTRISSPSTTFAAINTTESGKTKGLIMEKGQQNETKIVVPSANKEREKGEKAQTIKLPVAKSKCETLRPDLPICKSYMDNYLGRVREWADKHDERMEQQLGKACKLLASVPHVPTLCCQIFEENCNGLTKCDTAAVLFTCTL